VHEILELHVENLQYYLKRELEIERERLMERVFEKTLEQIFIENRLYQAIEHVSSNSEIHDVVAKGLEPFLFQLSRIPTEEDREKLLNIPIRRISRFDLNKNRQEIMAADLAILKVDRELATLKAHTIRYIKGLIAKYGKDFPRRTQVQSIERIDLRAIETKEVEVFFDAKSGFLGTKVSGATRLRCTNFDKIVLFYVDGTYQVISIPEKQYVHREKCKIAHVAVADKKTIVNIVFKDPQSAICFAKKFIVEKFILEKIYRYLEEGMQLQFFSTEPNPVVEVVFVPKARQKTSQLRYSFQGFAVKGVASKGVRIAPQAVQEVFLSTEAARSPQEEDRGH
jgi:topoisomerase-4 subunit A